MVRTVCAVSNCLSSYTNKERRFHRFPCSQDRSDQWIIKCGRSDLIGKAIDDLRHLYICNLHFEDQMYSKKHLKKTAIPTLLIPNLTNLSDETQNEPNIKKCKKHILNIPIKCNNDNIDNFQRTTTQNLCESNTDSSRKKHLAEDLNSSPKRMKHEQNNNDRISDQTPDKLTDQSPPKRRQKVIKWYLF